MLDLDNGTYYDFPTLPCCGQHIEQCYCTEKDLEKFAKENPGVLDSDSDWDEED